MTRLGNPASTDVARVLLVEDHASVRATLRLLIGTQPDLDVCGDVASAEEALSLVVLCGPDVVVLDVGLPGLDGITATRLLRERCPALGLAVITAEAGRGRREAAHEVGADAFVLKTDGPAALLDAVRAAGAAAALRRLHHV